MSIFATTQAPTKARQKPQTNSSLTISLPAFLFCWPLRCMVTQAYNYLFIQSLTYKLLLLHMPGLWGARAKKRPSDEKTWDKVRAIPNLHP